MPPIGRCGRRARSRREFLAGDRGAKIDRPDRPRRGRRRIQGQAAARAGRNGEPAPAHRARDRRYRDPTASRRLPAISWVSPTTWRAASRRSMRSCGRRPTPASGSARGPRIDRARACQGAREARREEVRSRWARSSIPICTRRCSRCRIPRVPAGTVAQVVQPGYMIGERILRPALVAVAKGGPKAAPAEAPANDNAGAASDDPGGGA